MQGTKIKYHIVFVQISRLITIGTFTEIHIRRMNTMTFLRNSQLFVCMYLCVI